VVIHNPSLVEVESARDMSTYDEIMERGFNSTKIEGNKGNLLDENHRLRRGVHTSKCHIV
jgi:hypothetical protein